MRIDVPIVNETFGKLVPAGAGEFKFHPEVSAAIDFILLAAANRGWNFTSSIPWVGDGRRKWTLGHVEICGSGNPFFGKPIVEFFACGPSPIIAAKVVLRQILDFEAGKS